MIATPSYLGIVSKNPKDGRNRSGVYGIINQARGAIYVGSSKLLSRRWSDHKKLLRKGKHTSPRLQNAWNKYGNERFQFVILAFCDVGALAETEQYYIDTLKPAYNTVRQVGAIPSSVSRNSGRKHSEETKQKMRGPRLSISGKNNPMYDIHLNGELNPMWGRKKPETAEFNRRTKKGRTLEEMHGDRAAAIRESRTNRGPANGNFGKGRAVLQLTMDGNIVAGFPSANRAAISLGRNPVSIYHCLAGIRGIKSAFGYRWKYKDDA